MRIKYLLAMGLMSTQTWVSAQPTEAPSQLSLPEAHAQRARAKDLKSGAEKAYKLEINECKSKAIAIRCISSAKDRRAELVKQADALDLEARTVEREERRKRVETKAAKRETGEPARQAKQQADIERHRESEAKRAAERERRQSKEAAKIESNRSKLAAEQAARQKKLEKQQRQDAAIAAAAPENARKKAEREQKQAERVKRIDKRKQEYAEKLKRQEAKQKEKQAADALKQ